MFLYIGPCRAASSYMLGRDRMVQWCGTVCVECPVIQPDTHQLLLYVYRFEIIYLGDFLSLQTEVFNDLFTYKIGKDEWRIVKGGAGPGPRSGHAAIALPFNRGEMWLFGGEYTTKTESQFYHYNDLWTLNLETRTWNRITSVCS